MKWPSLHCCSKTRDFIKGCLQYMSILCIAAVKEKTGLNKSLHWNTLSFPLTSAVNGLLSVTFLKGVVVCTEESWDYFPAFPLSFSNLLALSLCTLTNVAFPEKLGSSQEATVAGWKYWVLNRSAWSNASEMPWLEAKTRPRQQRLLILLFPTVIWALGACYTITYSSLVADNAPLF